MKNYWIILILFFTIFSLNAKAQKLSSSPFSRYGIGELFFQGNGQQLAMGQTGIAITSPFHISRINPATLSSIKPNSVIFEFGIFDKISVYQTQELKQTNNVANFKHIAGGFRVNRWWHTAFGVTPLSGLGYKVQIVDTLRTNESSTVTTINYIGDGSINQAFWSNSFTFFKRLSLGFNLNYNFGSIDKNSTTVISETSYQSLTSITTRNLISKFNYNLGLVYSDTLKFNKNRLKFSLGAIYSTQSSMKTIETLNVFRGTSLYSNTFQDSIFYDTLRNSSIILPQNIGFGISLNFNEKITLAVDYQTSNWSKSSILGETGFLDSRFLGFGLEYCNAPYSTKYFRTIRYRFGYYQNKSYVQVNNKQLQTQAVTFGLGLPFRTIQLNLGFVYGKTGSFEIGLLENFYEINLNVSLYDIWFIKRKFM